MVQIDPQTLCPFHQRQRIFFGLNQIHHQLSDGYPAPFW
ncbi:hypothetical protein D088_970242 [Salmonella enterica subsp. houtenae serovar 16:z4,z32:-- str. RKS3027]|nr:hypothetical protein D088_970242 [Salmonella enterica subsp. houtenae serovar 16:z4,z32:-- str. RKS3027]